MEACVMDMKLDHLIMDDTTNKYDFDDLAAFEATLDESAVITETKRVAEKVNPAAA